MRSFFLFGSALVATAAAPVAATVKDGVDAWQAGNFDKAIREWRGPAEAGDADAQFDLAQAYKLGRGVPADMNIAQSWYQKAAEQGHEQAQATLGLILFQNGQREAAMPWIRKAADRGEPRAQYVLGTALFNGDLAAKDWPRAYGLMTSAAAAGLPQAKTSLAEMDRFIPLNQRQQGMVIARGLTRQPGAAQASAAPVSATPVAAPAPARVAQAAPPAPARAVPPPAAAPRPVPAPGAPAPAIGTRAVAPVAAAPVPKAAPRPAAAAAPAAASAATAATGGGRWRVQLGAYGTQAAARNAWSGFGGITGLAGAQPSYVQAGAVYRLQAGPFADKAAAARACAAAVKAGKNCFPVAP